MPGKTKIPRTTMAAGSNRINSNFANKLDYNPVVKAMRSRIDSLAAENARLVTARTSLIEANNRGYIDLSNNSNAFTTDQQLDISNLLIDTTKFTLNSA